MTLDVRPARPAHESAEERRTLQHPYIPLTDDDRAAMLAAVGARSTDELFEDIPAAYRDPELRLPPALSELELIDVMRATSATNAAAAEYACFLGAGAYRHFRPALVDALVMRGEFLTSYTPYQPEVSQGTLQTIFEFQSIVCELTGMDVANAGMYDGASALAEACLMACAVTGRRRVVVSDRVHPNWIAVVRGYARGRGIGVDVQPHAEFALTTEDACLAVAQPDFLGRLSSDAAAWGDAAHAAGALFVVAADPISLALYRPPARYGAGDQEGPGGIVQRLATRTDAELVAEMHAMDGAALAALFRRYVRLIYRVAADILRGARRARRIGLDPRHIQQVADQLIEAIGLVVD